MHIYYLKSPMSMKISTKGLLDIYNTPTVVSDIARRDKTKELGARESAPLLDPGTGMKWAASLACC